ncbi:hypothetical protein ILYODFUR_026508 [Ilyodon furcidens]|uniref:Uncharacterized protein n=1 Tax=Ilyodon furcidens TaxID=33524 RepID=A0ABV0UMD9_9TELE
MSEVAVGGADAASLLSPPDINGRGDRLRNGHGSEHFPGKGTRLIAWRLRHLFTSKLSTWAGYYSLGFF